VIVAKERQRGTTLAELLVAVVFMAVCVSGIVASVTSSQRNGSFVRRRALALAEATGEIEKALSEGKAGTLTAKTNAAVTVSGLPGPGQYVRKTQSVSGYTSLYTVIVTVSWSEPTSDGSRDETLILTTVARCEGG
jgi:Tfp pilus assembly protein PilE